MKTFSLIYKLLIIAFVAGVAAALIFTFASDSRMLSVAVIVLGILVPGIFGIREYFYQRQLRWMRESEAYLAAKKAAQDAAQDTAAQHHTRK